MRIEAKHHTIGPRILAGIIDLLVVITLVILKVFLERPGASRALLIILAVVGFTAGHFYNVYFHGRFGQTLGKMVAKVKVLTVDEQPISYLQAFVRDSPYVVLALLALGFEVFSILTRDVAVTAAATRIWNIHSVLMTAFVVADILVTLANPKRRSLHDLIAGTAVVRTDV